MLNPPPPNPIHSCLFHNLCNSLLISHNTFFRRSPPQQPPGAPNRNDSSNQQPNTSRITDPILRSELGLIDLRPNNAHQLRTRIGKANGKTRRRRSVCCANALRPEDWVDANGACDRDTDDEVFAQSGVDDQEEDVAEQSYCFDWRKTVSDVSQGGNENTGLSHWL